MNPEKAKILIAEDNSSQARLMEVAIRRDDIDCEIHVVGDGRECLNRLAEQHYSALILDYNLPALNGLTVLGELKKAHSAVPVIMVTGEGSEEVAVQAMKNGAYDYLIKRAGYLELLPKTVEKAIEKNRLETELRRSELKYQTLVKSASDAIFVEDINLGILVEVNAKAIDMAGETREVLLTKSIDELFSGAEKIKIAAVRSGIIRRGSGTHSDLYIRQKDGSTIAIDLSANIIDFGDRKVIQYILRDVTEQKHLERQLIQAEKLATIGLLSSGIAHELRNPLNVIESARYYIEESIPAAEEAIKTKLDLMKKNIRRASGIINNLLEFSRRSGQDCEDLDASKVIESTLMLLEKEFSQRHIEIERRMNQVPKVRFNLDSLKQVFLNIIINAIQAMPEGGRLTIYSREVRENGWVEVDFQDTGYGISAAHLPYVFSPFFTTKDVGEGTGLGLYLSHSILKREKGDIFVKSEEGMGSTFTVRLPVASKSNRN